MTHRGGFSLSIIILRIGGGGPSFLLPWGPKILLLALLVCYFCTNKENYLKSVWILNVIMQNIIWPSIKTLENNEGTIKNGQSRETDNIRYTRRRKTKQKHYTICVGHHNTQTNTNTNNLNKTWTLLQTTRGKDELNIVFYDTPTNN